MITEKERIFALKLACHSARGLLIKYLKVLDALDSVVNARQEKRSIKHALHQFEDALEYKKELADHERIALIAANIDNE